MFFIADPIPIFFYFSSSIYFTSGKINTPGAILP